eukprot:277474_1
MSPYQRMEAMGDTIKVHRTGDNGYNYNDMNVNIFSEPLNQILRPNYLRNLHGDDDDLFDHYKMEVRRDNGVNGEKFKSATHYIDTMGISRKIQWDINNKHCDGTHPLHIHVNHFQVIECNEQDRMGFPDSQRPSNWIVHGDWHDVIDSSACVRFVTDLFGGDVLFHCHKLNHEDKGIMAQTEICGGGCDAQWNDMQCVGDSNPTPCLYNNNYCNPGNIGQFQTNWVLPAQKEFRLRNRYYFSDNSCIYNYFQPANCPGGRNPCIPEINNFDARSCIVDDEQYWEMDDIDDFSVYFRIKNKATNRCIGNHYVPRPPGCGRSCSVTDEWKPMECKNDDNTFYWKISNVVGGYFKIKNKAREVCLFQTDDSQIHAAECDTKGDKEYL